MFEESSTHWVKEIGAANTSLTPLFYDVLAYSVMLSISRFGIEIGEIMGINLDRLYRWWRHFEQSGIDALYDKGGGGAKNKIKPEDEEIIKKALANQLTLNGVMAEINGRTTVAFSKQTLQRHCKVMNYTYKRLRFSPPKEPDETLYEEKKANSKV